MLQTKSIKRLINLLILIPFLSFTYVCKADGAETVVSLYRIAPGQHISFIEYLALKEKAKIEAGLTPARIYTHSDGPEWDFLIMDSGTGASQEQIKTYKAAEKRLGVPTGNKGWVALRTFISSHEDLIVNGPVSASDWLKSVKE